MATKSKKSGVVKKRLRLLYDISSQEGLDAKAQLEKALKLTTEFLDLEIGIISNIEDDNYTVTYFYPEDAGLETGQVFPLGDTYCSITLEADEAVAIDYMKRSAYNRHPCYEAFKLESYIGMPVEIDGDLYGTLNFSSSKPRSKDFSDADKDYIRLLSEWVADILKLQELEEQTRQREQDSRRINERYNLAVQGISAGLWDWPDIEGKEEWWSPKFYELLGYEDGEIKASLDAFEQLLHPGDKEKTFEALDRHLQEGKPFAVEYRLKTKSGNYKWFFGSGKASFDDEGKPVRMVGSIVDIDDRKQAEIELANERKLLRTIIDNLPSNVYVKDREGKKLLLNRAEYEFLGAESEAELLGKTDYDLNTDEIASISVEEDRQVIENVEPMLNKDTYTVVDGKKYWFLVSKLPLENEQGDIVGLVGISTDITDRKQLEQILVDTQQMANVGGWEYNLETGNMLLTDEVYRIYELPIGTEVKVEDGISYYAPEARPIIQEAINIAVETGEGWDIELPFITAKGNRKWVRSIGKAHYKDGEAYKLSGTIQDLTSRKEMEDQILEQHEELKKLIDTTNKIYSVIGHDLRGPINSITGFTELLLSNLQNEKGAEDALVESLRIVHQSASNISRLLDNLLSWARIQTGNLSLVMREFSVVRVIERTIELLSPTAQRKDIEICFDQEEFNAVRGDDRMIETVVRNLISNAIKFSSGGDKIYVSLERDSEYWKLAVRDEGEGMSKEVQEKLFNSESHPTSTGTENEKGTGLGLLLCKELVEMHGGTIKAESKAGEGSTFTIHIPFHIGRSEE